MERISGWLADFKSSWHASKPESGSYDLRKLRGVEAVLQQHQALNVAQNFSQVENRFLNHWQKASK